MTGDKKKIKIYKGHIFAGSGRDETAIEYIEYLKEKGEWDDIITLTMGSTHPNEDEENEWFIFPCRLAKSTCIDMLFEYSNDVLHRADEAVKEKCRKEGILWPMEWEKYTQEADRMRKIILSQEEFEIDEDEFTKRHICKENGTVLHEVSFHVISELSHPYFPVGIRLKVPIENIMELVDKHGLRSYLKSVYRGDKRIYKQGINFIEPERWGDTLDKANEEENEKMKRSIMSLYRELKSYDPAAIIERKRKSYPVEFGLDDIKILA